MGHRFHPTFLREYDARGIMGESLTVADATALGRAYGTMIKRSGGTKVTVGYDGRLSSPDMEAALVDGITSTGVNVVRIGVGPTPMTYFAVFELDLDGGVMVTGSHNPPNYNGFKMMAGKDALFGDAIQELGRIAAAGDFEVGEGASETLDISERYISRIRQDFEGGPINVVWDTGNGSAGDIVRRLIDTLPGNHKLLNGEIDGTFPAHHPDPTVEANLAQLKEAVADGGYDLGIGFDGDGDRIGAIDRHGHVIWSDQLLAILARDVLKEVPGAAIIADIKCSQALFDDVEKHGGKGVIWKTGHSLIKAKMKELNSPLAGEMSGHIYFKHKYYGFDDAIYVAIRLLNSVFNQGDLAALRDSLPPMINTPELRFECDEEVKFEVVAKVQESLIAEGANISTIDGARVMTDEGWWLLRASNTQAVLVARVEASTDEGLEKLKDQLKAALLPHGLEAPDL